MNAPTVSKINWTALIIALIGVMAAFDVIPADLKEPLIEISMILLPSLIVVFRTWFTDKRTPSPPDAG